MADILGSNNVFSKLIGAEAAAPGTPAANTAILYVKADGLWYSKDDAGVETAVSVNMSAAARTVNDDASVSAMVDTLFGAAATGTGGAVRATTPTLVTPVLGVATATSINKVAVTAPATSATLALVDGTTVTGPAATGTIATLAGTETLTNKTLTTAALGSSTATTQSAGDNSTKVATTAYVKAADDKQAECIIIAASDETTALTTGTAKVTFRMPFAMTLTAVRASVTTAPTGTGNLTVDINEGGTTIISTKLKFDASEFTTVTAATPAVISDASLADDAEMTVDIDAVSGTVTGAGLKICLIGTRT